MSALFAALPEVHDVEHLIGVDWSLGVTASSSELQAIGTTFVVLRLQTRDEYTGEVKYQHLGERSTLKQHGKKKSRRAWHEAHAHTRTVS